MQAADFFNGINIVKFRIEIKGEEYTSKKTVKWDSISDFITTQCQ